MQRTNVLCRYLQERGRLHSPLLIQSFCEVDRKDFVPPEFIQKAYEDYPLAIGGGQTISQPSTVAFMLELLELKEDDDILDIGCGSGWTTALLATAASSGSVIAVERLQPLLERAQRNVAKYALQNVTFMHASDALGCPGKTFDKILVSAAAPELPQELIAQLRSGGIMVIPVGNTITAVYKHEGDAFEQQVFEGFVFVPLIY
ncbi:MAG: L-isoaspartyl protein carboxyl methyltransferase [Sulfurimonas sp.]|nr:MAG: L-isoaspartyl protein carboxyl methyltransferase [Sulfurimonas sp.]